MKKRKFPAVLRFHKFKIDTHPQEYFFSEALLYKPFKNEEDILKDLEIIDAGELHEQIQCVKEQVMEHLENVTEARYFVAENSRNEETEMNLDPEGIQENSDCEYEGIINHPDFPNFEIECLDHDATKKKSERTHKLIFDDIDKLMDKSKDMHFYQRKVLESSIGFARSLRKSLKLNNSSRNAPNMMVHGGAGSGKSTVINIMKQWVHRILEMSGDNPEYPYILVTAPTGTAAANIQGQT